MTLLNFHQSQNFLLSLYTPRYVDVHAIKLLALKTITTYSQALLFKVHSCPMPEPFTVAAKWWVGTNWS